MKNNKYEIDMCNGTIMDKLISFALPLMISGMLQLMFNAVDIIVVGRFTGSQALAAVGSTTALICTFTNLFIGVSLGANVLAARFYEYCVPENPLCLLQRRMILSDRQYYISGYIFWECHFLCYITMVQQY